jgi:hypothetical protein
MDVEGAGKGSIRGVQMPSIGKGGASGRTLMATWRGNYKRVSKGGSRARPCHWQLGKRGQETV